MRELSGDVYDLERLLARSPPAGRRRATCNTSPARWPRCRNSKRNLPVEQSALLSQLEAQLDLCPELRAMLESALDETCPLNARDGGFVRSGYSAAIDECRELMVGGKQWMARYQAEQIEATGITSAQGWLQQRLWLLPGSNPRSPRQSAGPLHSQANAQECRAVHHARAERVRREGADRGRARPHDWSTKSSCNFARASPPTRHACSLPPALAQLDVLAGLANLARSRNYCRPTIVDRADADNRTRAAIRCSIVCSRRGRSCRTMCTWPLPD